MESSDGGQNGEGGQVDENFTMGLALLSICMGHDGHDSRFTESIIDV